MMAQTALALVFLQFLAPSGLLFTVVEGGAVYLHNPRGSNNRNIEHGGPVTNTRRLFDAGSNSDMGGYGVGGDAGLMTYYAGSQLSVQFSADAGCGDAGDSCVIVIQYTCGDSVRDGNTTASPSAAYPSNLSTGLHESPGSFAECSARARNGGLYTGGTALSGASALHTRQNPIGAAAGLECSEERDYYPYWHPSDWVDVAILTNDLEHCHEMRMDSQNVKGKGHCCGTSEASAVKNNGFCSAPACIAKATPAGCAATSGCNWATRSPWMSTDASIVAPECIHAPFLRAGGGGGSGGAGVVSGQGYLDLPTYNWTLPGFINRKPSLLSAGGPAGAPWDSQSCALRVRYNVSVSDSELPQAGIDCPSPCFKDSLLTVDATMDSTPLLSLGGSGYGTASVAVAAAAAATPDKGTVVDIGFGDELSLMVGIDQSTFAGTVSQDRTHTFQLAPRSEAGTCSNAVQHNGREALCTAGGGTWVAIPATARIFNLNILGKQSHSRAQPFRTASSSRLDIAGGANYGSSDVSPALPYSFAPRSLSVGAGDFVHVQWTGSDSLSEGSVFGGTGLKDSGNSLTGAIPVLTSGQSRGRSGIERHNLVATASRRSALPMHKSSALKSGASIFSAGGSGGGGEAALKAHAFGINAAVTGVAADALKGTCKALAALEADAAFVCDSVCSKTTIYTCPNSSNATAASAASAAAVAASAQECKYTCETAKEFSLSENPSNCMLLNSKASASFFNGGLLQPTSSALPSTFNFMDSRNHVQGVHSVRGSVSVDSFMVYRSDVQGPSVSVDAEARLLAGPALLRIPAGRSPIHYKVLAMPPSFADPVVDLGAVEGTDEAPRSYPKLMNFSLFASEAFAVTPFVIGNLEEEEGGEESDSGNNNLFKDVNATLSMRFLALTEEELAGEKEIDFLFLQDVSRQEWVIVPGGQFGDDGWAHLNIPHPGVFVIIKYWPINEPVASGAIDVWLMVAVVGGFCGCMCCCALWLLMCPDINMCQGKVGPDDDDPAAKYSQ